VADALLETWMFALEERHLADLTFQEVSRALRALSSTYVERRRKLAEGAALSGAGKRAAFALFYAPLHFLIVRHIVAALPGALQSPPLLLDLGCGTGAAGSAWACAGETRARVVGIDRHQWALAEAGRTYRHFGLDAAVRRGDVASTRLPKHRVSLVAAFTVNELADEARRATLATLIARGGAGDSILIVEPLAKSATPWWDEWRRAFEQIGGRADEWRFQAALPPLVAKLDRAAGLNHHELTARSLWIGSRSA